MEVMSYVVEEVEPTVRKRFCEKLIEVGFKDFHSNAIERFCKSLKELLDIDLMKVKSFSKEYLESSRPCLLVNTSIGGIIIISESEEEACVKGKAFEVTCFAKSWEEADKVLAITKDLLTKKLGFASAIIHNGSFDENCNKNLIRSLSETHRSDLAKKVEDDALKVFLNKEASEKLRRLTTFPIKTFDKSMIQVNPDTLVASGIMTECFAPVCKKCGGSALLMPPYLFNSKKDVSTVLKSKSIVCPSCGNKLNSENATVSSFYQFTNLGLECSKGLWLEAYVKSILEKLGISGDRIKLCSVHGKDELDIVFSEGDSLFICECRDRVIGQNDLYVLAMKVSRINENINEPATVDKVLIISTESIPKDILITPQGEELEYIPATGSPEEIKRELVKAVKKARRRYENKKLKALTRILLWFLPSVVEEAYMRRIIEEEDFGL